MKFRKITALLMTLIISMSVIVVANAEQDENTPLEVLKTAENAAMKRDINTFFEHSYTEGYETIDKLQELWDNDDDFVLSYEVLNEKYKDDNLAVYLTRVETKQGRMHEVSIFVKKIDGVWKVYCGADIDNSPYYEYTMLFSDNSARNSESDYIRKTPEKKYYATIDGEFREITREESVALQETIDLEEDENININNTDGNTDESIIPLALSQICNWSFTGLGSFSNKDTYSFNYSAGNSNKQITLNLKQWRNDGSTSAPTVQYALRRTSNGYLEYFGEQDVTGYYPDSSSTAKQIKFSMSYSNINNLFVRITPKGSYYVSGYGEAYNY